MIALSLHFACVSGITSTAAYSSGSPGFQSAAWYARVVPAAIHRIKRRGTVEGLGSQMDNVIFFSHWRYQIAQPCCIWKVNEGEEEAPVVYLSVSGAGYSLSGVLSKMSFTSLTQPDHRGRRNRCCHTSH